MTKGHSFTGRMIVYLSVMTYLNVRSSVKRLALDQIRYRKQTVIITFLKAN